MSNPVRAIQALRWNYRWAGVRIWLKATVTIPGYPPSKGWRLVVFHPQRVRDFMGAVAEGVTS